MFGTMDTNMILLAIVCVILLGKIPTNSNWLIMTSVKNLGTKLWQSRKLLMISFAFVTLFTFLIFSGSGGFSNDSETFQIQFARHIRKLKNVLKTNRVISLDKMNLFEDMITVSGLSSGASMATQFHISHSTLLSGLAMFSQAFYRCGPKSLDEFMVRCTTFAHGWLPYNVSSAISDARNYEQQSLIDPLENLVDHKVFIWTGWADEYVPVAIVKQNKEFYSAFIPDPKRISLNVNPVAKHLLPTKNFGDACDQDPSKNVYLANCNYSGAYYALRFLLGSSVITPNNGKYNPSSLMLYNQSVFYPGKDIKEVAMGALGWIYFPKKCEEGKVKCYLHIHFHGCHEFPTDVAKTYIENNEFLPIAETNNIILIFPLTTKVRNNMGGCWDFYSYTGKDFATKNGKQIQVIHRLLQRVLGGAEKSSSGQNENSVNVNMIPDTLRD